MRTETEAASINVAIWAVCPDCDTDINLLEIETLTEEGRIYQKTLGEKFGGADLKLDYECPVCGKKLRTDTVCW